jgi:hypothetical protein
VDILDLLILEWLENITIITQRKHQVCYWKLIGLGTPGYMAPEVLSNQNYSFSADLYAVGVILYEMIIGARPFKGKTRKQMRDLVTKKQP